MIEQKVEKIQNGRVNFVKAIEANPCRNPLVNENNRFYRSTDQELNTLIARDNAIRLLDAIINDDRVGILDAAINMTTEDATRLRNQIQKHRNIRTPTDKAIIEGAEFAIRIIERKELRTNACSAGGSGR